MAEFTVDEVCLATHGKRIGSLYGDRFTGVCTDTRAVKPGDLFIPLIGENFDGHNFIHKAIAGGAAGVLTSRLDLVTDQSVTMILVADTLLALQGLACFHRKRFSIPIIAITGSNGKTTTKDMTAAVLASRFEVLKTEANFNNEIGLPLTLLQLHDHHEVAVVEMGMRGKGQIRQLANIALPTIAVITNVGETHMELLGSIEDIAIAKAELLESIPENGLTILNADNPYVRSMESEARSRVTFFGLEQGDVRGEEIHTDEQGMNFICHCTKEEFPVFIPTIGKHNVYNALSAVAIALELRLTADEIRLGLRNYNASPMRLHVQEMSGYLIVNDAYNASPMSMAAAIDTLLEVAKGRTVAVLGDMLELGHIAVEAHRQIGEKLAEGQVDIVLTVGTLASHIAKAAREKGVKTAVACNSHEEAQETLKQILKPGDSILIKGSRGMKMEKIITMFL